LDLVPFFLRTKGNLREHWKSAVMDEEIKFEIFSEVQNSLIVYIWESKPDSYLRQISDRFKF
jgi:hypothetical protein